MAANPIRPLICNPALSKDVRAYVLLRSKSTAQGTFLAWGVFGVINNGNAKGTFCIMTLGLWRFVVVITDTR